MDQFFAFFATSGILLLYHYSYLISKPISVLLIISLGPTGPAVSEATADSNSG